MIFLKKMLLRVYLFLLLLASVHVAISQTIASQKNIPVHARLMTVDELGNAYIVQNDNTILRYNEQGDSTGFYKSILNGEISTIDATNPLRVLVYYPAYAKVIILDRMLAPQNELDLKKINLSNVTVIASGADGMIWVYDRFNARLKKVDDRLKEIVRSNDLRQELQSVPNPVFATERNWKTYLCDTAKGIYIFDRYGSYVNMLSIYNVRQLQVIGSTLVYKVNDSLYSWDQEKIREERIAIPQPEKKVLNALLIREKLYVLYENELVIYKLSKD